MSIHVVACFLTHSLKHGLVSWGQTTLFLAIYIDATQFISLARVLIYPEKFIFENKNNPISIIIIFEAMATIYEEYYSNFFALKHPLKAKKTLFLLTEYVSSEIEMRMCNTHSRSRLCYY